LFSSVCLLRLLTLSGRRVVVLSWYVKVPKASSLLSRLWSIALLGSKIRGQGVSLVLALAFLPTCLAIGSASACSSSKTAALPTGITLSVDRDGSYTIVTQVPSWRFAGTVGHRLTHITVTNGRDSIGDYREIGFSYQATVGRHSGIRAYIEKPVVVFTTTYLASAPNSEPFPILQVHPRLPYHFSYQDTAFGTYLFNGTNAGESPCLYFDTQAHSFMLSPATNFQIAQTVTNADDSIAAGIALAVTTLPRGFTHRTMLVLGNGINNTFQSWGEAIRALAGKRPVPNDFDVTLNRLGYWTDNGAAYYYKYDAAKGYEGTLLAVKADFAARGIPLAYMQLDSWWYPKGSSGTWQGDGADRGGEYIYRAAPDLFPDGLTAFFTRLGLPLVVHARWIDHASPYRFQYRVSCNVITDPQFWDSAMRYLKDCGVVAYEQDWLSLYAQPQYNLNDPDAFLGNMARAATTNGLTMQYCMPLPRDYLQSTLYQNLITTRVSGDRFDRNRWDEFLYDSRLASALGEWPWADVFMSNEIDNLLLATLSAGIVGVGDPMGRESRSALMQSVLPDGVIVKPDSPIVPLDQTYLGEAGGPMPPMVAGTFTQRGSLRAAYIFAYARGAQSTQTIAFTPAELGMAGSADYVYDYFTRKGTLLKSSDSFTDLVSGGSYYIVAPVGPSGIAFLGDTGKFVSLGRKRITQLADDGRVKATVAFADGEQAVTLHGYAEKPPRVEASEGIAGPLFYDPSSHRFNFTVSPGTGRVASIALTTN